MSVTCFSISFLSVWGCLAEGRLGGLVDIKKSFLGARHNHNTPYKLQYQKNSIQLHDAKQMHMRTKRCKKNVQLLIYAKIFELRIVSEGSYDAASVS